MPNIRFLYNNQILGTSVSVSAATAASGLPASNIQIPERSLVWRSLVTTGDQYVIVDLGSSISITAVAVANALIHAGGSLQCYYGTNGTSWTIFGTFAALDTDSKAAVLFGSVTARYLLFSFVNTAAVSAYVELGYAFGGTYIEPSHNVRVPFDVPLGSRSAIALSPAGQRTVAVRPQFTTGRWTWDTLADADIAALQAMFRTCDQGTPFFQVLDTTRGWTTWLAHFSGPLSRVFGLLDAQYDPGFEWQEAL